MTNLTFQRAVEIAVNLTMVKVHARQFHSPGGAIVGPSSSKNVNRVRSVTEESPDEQDDHFMAYSTARTQWMH